jgi:dihydrofolate reductase
MSFEKIIGIGASDLQGVMGQEGTLPWHYPEDLKYFAETTQNHPLVMGYQTFLSLPRHYFEQRQVIVFTRKKELNDKNSSIIFVHTITDFLAIKNEFKELYVAGGAQIYTLFFRENLIDEFILTTFKRSYEGDTYFPLSLLNGWASLVIRETDELSIYRYFNPKKKSHGNKDI